MALEEMEIDTPDPASPTPGISKEKKMIFSLAALVFVVIIIIAVVGLYLGLNKCAKGYKGKDCKECDFEVQVPERNCQGIPLFFTSHNLLI